MRKIERRLFLRGMTAGAAGGLTGLIQQALAADAKSLKQGIIRLSGDVSVNGKPASEGMPSEANGMLINATLNTKSFLIKKPRTDKSDESKLFLTANGREYPRMNSANLPLASCRHSRKFASIRGST